MEDEEKLVRVFTGPEQTALLLLKMLEQSGISGLIKNDSGLGYLGSTPEAVDLYIFETDKEKAGALVDQFINRNE